MSHSFPTVNLDAIKGTGDTKESEILIGEEGIQIAKNLSSEIKRAINNGGLTLTINGTMLLPDNQSFSISEPTASCQKGQILRKIYCCKFEGKKKIYDLLMSFLPSFILFQSFSFVCIF